MAMTPPTSLPHSLRFERRANIRSGGGVVKADWSVIDGLENFRASVLPTRGGESVIAGRQAGNVPYDMWLRSCRATRSLLPSDRAVNLRTGEVYNLSPAIDPFGTRQWLLVQATSGGNAEGQG